MGTVGYWVYRHSGRKVGRLLSAPFRPRQWRALGRTLATFESPLSAIVRYVSNRGRYPWTTRLRTPLGPITVTIVDSHDLLTVNEVFCRRDYGGTPRRVVVDIGANVGFATLFFLTRHRDTRVWAFEPDPANMARLRDTLAGFEDRFSLVEAAVVANEAPTMRFVPAGRYGRRARPGEAGVEVRAISIARALREVAEQAGRIDLVKIDTEGTELELVRAIPDGLSISEVRYEGVSRVFAVRPPAQLPDALP